MLREIAPGLVYWTAPHPAWKAEHEPGSSADWPQEVGSVLYETPDAVVVVDPMLPPDPESLWPALDERISGRPVVVLTTVRWHKRSRDAFVERYGAAVPRVWRGEAPAGVEPIRVSRTLETLMWLPDVRTLVPGDLLVACYDRGLEVCPRSWLHWAKPPIEPAELRSLLAPLLELPVERVLVSHGELVLSGGAEALRGALARGWIAGE